MLRVTSGGQTGVDRGALEAAMELGLPHGGCCPRGRLAEDSAVPAKYSGLVKLETASYEARTFRNVRDSDATLILHRAAPLAGGTELTARLATQLGKPCLCLLLDRQEVASNDQIGRILCWLHEYHVANLNIAGPRESEEPGIQSVCVQNSEDCAEPVFGIKFYRLPLAA